MAEQIRVRCPGCEAVVAARVPQGGDGSAVMPYRHPRGQAVKCSGSYRVVSAAEAWSPDEEAQ